jgi:hypothetical protein
MDIVLEVLKWVVIVLIAGFIGQFGKTMSQQVMGYFKKRKDKKSATQSMEINGTKKISTEIKEANRIEKEIIPPSTKELDEKQHLKSEKKIIKAQLKAKKKSEKSTGQ